MSALSARVWSVSSSTREVIGGHTLECLLRLPPLGFDPFASVVLFGARAYRLVLSGRSVVAKWVTWNGRLT